MISRIVYVELSRALLPLDQWIVQETSVLDFYPLIYICWTCPESLSAHQIGWRVRPSPNIPARVRVGRPEPVRKHSKGDSI